MHTRVRRRNQNRPGVCWSQKKPGRQECAHCCPGMLSVVKRLACAGLRRRRLLSNSRHQYTSLRPNAATQRCLDQGLQSVACRSVEVVNNKVAYYMEKALRLMGSHPLCMSARSSRYGVSPPVIWTQLYQPCRHTSSDELLKQAPENHHADSARNIRKRHCTEWHCGSNHRRTA